MYISGKYTANDTMGGLIGDNYRVLLVMSRFGLGLGFGEKTIGEVCAQAGVDAPTFLAVANLQTGHTVSASSADAPSLGALLDYLHSSHDYFLGFRLPAIRTSLEAVLAGADEGLGGAVLRYFDEYVGEVRTHMDYEESTVFPYVRALIAGQRTKGYSISVFSSHHDHVEARLAEFKRILLKYYPAQSTNEMNGVLFDIFNCEDDLASHNEVEDRLFVPAIEALEANKPVRL